jgi:site-specific DNA recombinase
MSELREFLLNCYLFARRFERRRRRAVDHRYRGTCDNRLLIRLDRLEAQLLAGLEARVLCPAAVEYVVRRLQDAIESSRSSAIKNVDSRSSALGPLNREKSDLNLQVQRIADAIAAAGHPPFLLQRLSQIERMLVDVDRKIAASQPPKLELTPTEIRGFVTRKLLNLRALLRENVSRAKRERLEHVKEIVLTPVQNKTAYAVSGNWEFLPTVTT